MARWSPARLDRYSVAVATLIFAAVWILIAQAGVKGMQPAEVLRVLAAMGFAEELMATTVGLIALAFLAGRGSRTLVVAGGVMLIVLANSTMFTSANMLTNYPTEPGAERGTLLQLAENSPNESISDEIPVLLRLGENLGTSQLTMPLFELGDRVRALTDIDVVVVAGPYDIAPTNWAQIGEVTELGMMGNRPVVVVGRDDQYVWVDGPDTVFVVARTLLGSS